MADTKVFDAIMAMLQTEDIQFRHLHHEPTYTSEDSARVRGESTMIGGKSLLMKIGDSFKLFVVSAALKLDSRAIKDYFHEKYFRFATREELMEMTGLYSGSVPPFGRPILDFDLFIDNSVTKNERIAFNAGSLEDSIIMQTPDYLKLVERSQPIFFDFSEKVSGS
ncbi:MAG: YbaK/EbsC family protein [Candidatus Gracilibacteria bacterium]